MLQRPFLLQEYFVYNSSVSVPVMNTIEFVTRIMHMVRALFIVYLFVLFNSVIRGDYVPWLSLIDLQLLAMI